MMSDLQQVFIDEAQELLTELESTLLELERSPGDEGLVNRAFRALHTIKGSGAMFGYEGISTFAHEIESVYAAVRDGSMEVSVELVRLTLLACDLIRGMLSPRSGEQQLEARTMEVAAAFKGLVGGTATMEPVNVRGGLWEATPIGGASGYHIMFKPSPRILSNGTNPIAILNELRTLGECRITVLADNIPPLTEMDASRCYIGWEIMLATDRGIDAVKDVFDFVAYDSDLTIEPMEADEIWKRPAGVEQSQPVAGVMEPPLPTQRDDVDDEPEVPRRLGDILVDRGLVAPEELQSALLEQQTGRSEQRPLTASGSTSSIRVGAEKLDKLVNLVGELVTVQARLTRTAIGNRDPALIAIAEEVERLTSELRTNALNISMLPIGSTFSRFRRLVHDLAIELGKEVELSTEGSETELDKTVIERLNDPLVHLIRNCIDHGIERPELREGRGKGRSGRIHLAAAYAGDSVVISISDDGAGIDMEAVRQRAVAKGLLAPEAEPSGRELMSLIFAPGFSTSREITSISGRGVGMDVVKRDVESLHGSIAVSSRPGEGTVVSIKIPLTLAIIESLLVRVENEHYVFPLSLVQECLELSRRDVERAHGRHLISLRDAIVPYIPLRDRFGMSGPAPDLQQVVIVETGSRRIGLVVDEVVGEHQAVIKSMGKMLRHVTGVSGATILGDGSVALILDVQGLAMEEEALQERHAGMPGVPAGYRAAVGGLPSAAASGAEETVH